EEYVARRRVVESDDRLPERGLATTGFTDKAKCFTTAHGERHIIDRLNRHGAIACQEASTEVKVLLEVAYLQHIVVGIDLRSRLWLVIDFSGHALSPPSVSLISLCL